MISIAEFLEERIAEDEAAAQTAHEATAGLAWDFKAGDPVQDHLTRWQPPRVLAECKAKRDIFDYESGDLRSGDIQSGVMLTMALVYKDHPDWDRSWYTPHGEDLLPEWEQA